MLDIILTTYNRIEFLKRTLDSIFTKTRGVPYRLFVRDDCSTDGTADYLASLKNERLCHVALGKKRCGLRLGFNMLWGEVEAYDLFHDKFPYLCYHQDDVEILDERWAEVLLEAYQGMKDTYNVGFFSGCDYIQHLEIRKLQWNGKVVMLKSSQAFQNAIAEKTFWRSVGIPGPKRNP